MTNFKIIVEYDGRPFFGWQRQGPGRGPTVQGVLEEALSRLCGHPVTLHGSGRTDAGVHARGQAASFFTASSRTAREVVRGGNSLLPPAVAILAAEEAEADFHARFSARAKVYEYDYDLSPTRRPLRQGRAWRVGPGLDWAEVELALPALVGEHDFRAFQAAGGESRHAVRTIFSAELSSPEPDLRRLTLAGSGFLRHMVRTMAGLLGEIGRGRLPAAALPQIILAGDRGRAGPTAPPDGLCLARVIY
ncbi:MAG: tRNA pseudouridine(38-40) synthase TruA [Deltaproteobacteria bacterium]|nr:tRNA pseudouridine(38-40) synthase TruA [Deltaproteobacteria bacterium]